MHAVTSPDGKSKITFTNTSSGMRYEVHRDLFEIITPSDLSFELIDGSIIGKRVSIIDVEASSSDEEWEQVWGEKRFIQDQHNEIRIKLKNEEDPKIEYHLVARAYNDGVAFRFHFPEQDILSTLQIADEHTHFNISGNPDVWWNDGYLKNIADPYEKIFQNTKVDKIDYANTPITFEWEGKFAAIHEANLTDYSEMKLKPGKSGNDLRSFLAEGPNGIKVERKVPFDTPWRTIQLADNEAGLIENYLILNLNEPNQIEDVSWIQPMKYIGIWWSLHLGIETWMAGDRHGATTENAKRYIDFAAANNIQGVLIEGWNAGWETWLDGDEFNFLDAYDDFDLEEVATYAKSKGVDIIGHHETGDDIPRYENEIREAFELYRKNGIRAIKTGYAGPTRPDQYDKHGQWKVNHYRMVEELAAEYGIMIDAHEPIKDTGLRRTLPNSMTREGVRGMEWNAWSDGNPPSHTVILPFTRGLSGPIDYTPGIFDVLFENSRDEMNEIFSDDEVRKNARVHTTIAKQLALFVTLYSPMQMAADLIENYEQYDDAFQFIRDVPVDWEDTKVINAKIGQYYTVARQERGGKDWFIGSTTNEEERVFDLNMDFLDENITYKATIYRDADDANWETNPTAYTIEEREVKSGDVLEIKLAAGGGAAIAIKAIE
ncbi:MAG: glycoside hydrolase family 97 protein [Cyclobacteriaceae bacterium]|nr:glycoside hydrolase family 97 protein [Cyclobacteriaceae bacterium]